jgi:uncharacterized damage-inducible protein DinB
MHPDLQKGYELFQYYQALRTQMMALLTDEALSFRVATGNPSLGALCREIGEVERSYIDSFKSFEQHFEDRAADPALETSVAALQAWYARLDQDLEAVLDALSESDVRQRRIDRGDGFEVSPRIQLEIYKEALLIFYGKASVYLKALGISLPEQWVDWIG